ncbi:hypothetical protein [Microbulbifer sp. PAAF003]|uniref:hypothetical protein n=1 Tax=Microbulbifer sp. PAAF003 TaxID=3243375 RepID=UPI004039F475
MKQVAESEWVRGHYDHSLVLPFSWEQLERMLGFIFQDCEEDGLGLTKIAGAKLGSGKQISFEHVLLENKDETIVYSIFNPEPDYEALSEMLYELKVSSETIVWESPFIRHKQYKLCRIDDNDNQFLVGTYRWESDAKLKMDALTKHPHKQNCWIELVQSA